MADPENSSNTTNLPNQKILSRGRISTCQNTQITTRSRSQNANSDGACVKKDDPANNQSRRAMKQQAKAEQDAAKASSKLAISSSKQDLHPAVKPA